MSASARAVAAALRAGLRPLLALTLLGAIVGLAWGLAEEPEYAATATVVVNDRGEAAEQAGSGAAGNGGAATIDRLLEIARGEELAELAAASLGGDVAGADLLARTEFRGSDRGGAVAIRSVASFPDFAAAAANAYAAALVELGTVFERRRLQRAEERLRDRLAEVESLQPIDPLEPVDPVEAAEEAAALNGRIEAVVALQELGPPLREGKEAELPTEPEPGRSAARAAAAGAAIGLALALLGLLAVELVRRPIRTPGRLERLLGAPTLAVLGPGPPPVRSGVGEGAALSAIGLDRMQALAGAIGLDRPTTAPRTVAVSSPLPGEGRTSVALGLAAASAARGARVLLVECDLRRPALAELLGIPPEPGLSDYLVGEARPRQVIRSVPIDGPGGGSEPATLVCVTAGSELGSPGQVLAGSRFRALVEQLRRVYELVVLDTAPLLIAPEAAIVTGAAEATVLCARAGATGGREVGRARERIGPSELLGGVLVGAPHLGPGLRRIDARPAPSGGGPSPRSRSGARRPVRRREVD